MSRHSLDVFSLVAGVVVVALGLIGIAGRFDRLFNHPDQLWPAVLACMALVLVASSISGRRDRPRPRRDTPPPV